MDQIRKQAEDLRKSAGYMIELADLLDEIWMGDGTEEEIKAGIRKIEEFNRKVYRENADSGESLGAMTNAVRNVTHERLF